MGDVIDPDEWLKQQSGAATNEQTAVAPKSTDVIDPDKWIRMQTQGASAAAKRSTDVIDPDEWIRMQTQGASAAAKSNVQNLNKTPAASSKFKPPTVSSTGQAGLAKAASSMDEFLHANPSGIVPEMTPADLIGKSPLEQRLLGLDVAGTKGVLEQVNPLNVAIMAATGGISSIVKGVAALKTIAPLITKVLPALGFGAPAVKQGATTLGEVSGTPSSQTTPYEQTRKFGEGALETGMGVVAAGLGDNLVELIKTVHNNAVETTLNSIREAKGIRVQSPQTEAEPDLGKIPSAPLHQPYVAQTEDERQKAAGLPKGYVPPNALSDRALNEAQTGIVESEKSSALGDLWRQQLAKTDLGMVKPSTEVQAPAPVDETRGKISYAGRAEANAIPSARQQRAQPLDQKDVATIEQFLRKEKARGEEVKFPSQGSPYQQWR